MTVGVFFQPGINYYVPQMSQSPGVGDDGLFAISLGNPIVAAINTIVITANGTITNAAKTFNAALLPTVFPFTIDAIYGRTLQVQGATAGDNAVLTVRGVDYLGQPTAENITLNGVTAVQGNKAFKRVDSVAVVAGNANASSSIQLGVGAKFGLPFKTHAVLGESADDVPAAAGTLTNPVLTDPATAVTGDTRGTYTPSTTPNGVRVIALFGRVSKTVNANSNGGMHGIRQFFT